MASPVASASQQEAATNAAQSTASVSDEPSRKLMGKGKEVATPGSIMAGPSQTNGTMQSSLADTASQHSHAAADAGQDPSHAVAGETMSSSPPEKQEQMQEASAFASSSSAPADTREKERDKGSLSTTVTASGTQSKHAKEKTTTIGSSEHVQSMEKSTSASGAGNQKGSKKRKGSLLSWLFMLLVPCVGSSKRGHVAFDDTVSGDLHSSSADALREKQLPESEKEAEARETATQAETSETHALEPSMSSTAVPTLTIPADASQLPSANESVIVPPSPTKYVLPDYETAGVTSGAVQPPGSTGEEAPRDAGDDSDGTSFTEDDEMEKEMEEVEDEEERLILNGGVGIPIGPDGTPRPLLPPIAPQHAGRKCLVLDLDETLLHSSFKSIQHADYVVPVEIEYHWHNVYVIKRPGVDNFLKRMGELYEVVVFTASLSKYADPVLDKLDVNRVVTHRLFRESCYNHKGNYVKDLSQLGRPMADTIILDNSPASYIFHPNNAVPVSSWFNDPHDTELTDLCPFLDDLGTVDDVRGVLDGGL